MNFFRNLPIKRKVILVVVLSSMLTLLMASCAMFAFQWFTTRAMITRDLMTQAEIIAANSAGALRFKDPDAANEILASLQAKPRILSACLYLPDHSLFARYGRAEDRQPLASERWPDGFHFHGPHLLLFQPVVHDHKRAATLFLRFDFDAMQREMTKPYLSILILIVLASLLVALVLSTTLQRLISEPVLSLATTARSVAEQKDYSVRAKLQSTDELGLLTRAFNHMLAQIQADDAAVRTANLNLQSEVAERQRTQARLEDMHRQMLDASRKAGMAEVATGVLHNVGNILNSINVSATLAVDHLRQSKIASLPKLSRLFADHAADLGPFLTQDEKGRQLPAYIATLSEHLVESQRYLLNELESLRRNLDHVKGIVAMQQSYAKVSGVVEQVAMAELVDDALKLSSAALLRQGVEVRRDYADVPLVSVDKHKVLQIVINLLSNARQALKDPGQRDKRLQLRLGLNGSQRVRLQVIDNGVGIPPENLTRIFAHGFTTRTDGHGFGLHSSALAAMELGGSLTGHSDGPGTGATFTLELPLNTEGA
ncbi:MAG: HAMP domain-containing protein [Verrucomicrobia bacterium]|nr:HAMP domain-containing protein [Verrucomicrobiota bacterium]